MSLQRHLTGSAAELFAKRNSHLGLWFYMDGTPAPLGSFLTNLSTPVGEKKCSFSVVPAKLPELILIDPAYWSTVILIYQRCVMLPLVESGRGSAPFTLHGLRMGQGLFYSSLCYQNKEGC